MIRQAAPILRTIAMPADSNPSGDIFGGWLMAQMDLAASSIAARRAKGRCATVAVDQIHFQSPIKIGDEVSIYGRIERVGSSSIAIRLEAWKRPRHAEEESRAAQGLFTFVALDPEGRPRLVPPG